MLNNAAIQIQESSSDLRNYIDTVELDPQRLNEIEERMGMIHDISRKHQISPEALPELQNNLSAELSRLTDDDQNLESLEAELQSIEHQYREFASQLSKQRKKAAGKLNKLVTESIRELGMPSISFQIDLNKENNENISMHGYETIEYMISPNPGQPQKPLRKIASGGELSRISLAIQTVLADSTHIPTLIYDEVDAGIGGPTAEVVGRKLRALGGTRQVMCVTHLAQVASQAHQHLKVSKKISKNTTTSMVEKLELPERIEETARMLGGLEMTKQSLMHAKEMIESAHAVKKRTAKKSRQSA